jgi:hypothetical protein
MAKYHCGIEITVRTRTKLYLSPFFYKKTLLALAKNTPRAILLNTSTCLAKKVFHEKRWAGSAEKIKRK